MSEPPTEVDRQLALIEHQVASLARPEQAAEEIADVLDALFRQGADVELLSDAQERVSQLLDMAATRQRAFDAALAAAKELNRQREFLAESAREARQQLEQLVKSVTDGDPTGALEVHQIKQALEDELFDSSEWTEIVEVEAIDTIYVGSPLEYHEVSLLWRILIGGDIEDSETSLWEELREWLNRAELELRRIYEPD